MPTANAQSGTSTPSKGLSAALWIVQALLAVTFVGTGIWKVATPIAKLAAMIPWAGQVSPALLYATAAFDALGGVGVLLPSLTRIKPGLAVAAAIGCALLQASAIVFHLSRGEGANVWFNCVLVALAVFVAWGRRARVPIAPRG